MLYFVVVGFVWFSVQTVCIYCLEQHQLLVVDLCNGEVYGEVRTEFLNIIRTSFGFKGLKYISF
jgi:hypothetical protein